MSFDAAPVVAAWDGARRLAVFWRGEGAAPARALVAETPSGRAEVLDSLGPESPPERPLAGVLPPGARAASVVLAEADGALRTILLNLDPLFAADRVPDGAGVERIALRSGDPASGEPPLRPAPEGGARDPAGLNRMRIGDDGVTRVLVGPFERPDEAQARNVAVSARLAGSGAVIELRGATPKGAGDTQSFAPVLVAHLPAAADAARRALGGMDASVRTAIEATLDDLHASIGRDGPPDASGAAPVAARRRGFFLLRPTFAAPGENAVATVTLDPFDPADQALVVTAGRGRATFGGDGEPVSGVSLLLRLADGGFVASATVETYAPAEATRLAAIGGGRALAASGQAFADRPSDVAAEALRAARNILEIGDEDDPSSTSLAQALDAAFGAPAAADLLAQLPADEEAIDSLRERGAEEQVAMLLLGGRAPALARRACAARLLPGRAGEEFSGLLGWFEDPALPRRLALAATADSTLDRASRRLLHEVAAIAGEVWLSAEIAAEARGLLAVSDASPGRRSELDALLGARGGKGPRGAAASWDLDRIALMRAQLQDEAAQSGQSETLRRELGARLLSLAPAEIVALHEVFAQILREREQAEAACETILSWESAAGLAGLAEKRRPGDILAGAASLAKASAEAVRAAAGLDALAAAFAGVERRTAHTLGEIPEPSARTDALRRTLLGYGRLLALHVARAEADAHVARRCAALPEDARQGLAAEGVRLRAGAVETLDRYLAIACVDGEAAWAAALNPPDPGPGAGRPSGDAGG